MANEATIDELQIEISATSASAADNLEKLAQKLERLEAITSRITGGSDGLNKVAKQIDKLNAISQKIQSMQGFEKLGKAVDQLAKLDRLSNVGDISGFVRNLNKLSQAGNALAQMPSVDTAKFRQLADALKSLEKISAGNINSTLNSLRKIPKISQELAGVDFTRLTQQIQQISTAMEPLVRQAERGGAGLTALAQIMQRTNRTARQSTGGFSLFNQTIGDIKVKTLAAIAGLRRLLSVLKNGVTASAAYVENLNLFKVTMGDSADEALRFAENVNAALGVDTSDWIRYQGVFQSIGKGFGIVSSQADVMSKNLTQLSYDISSFYNITADIAAEKLQSALSGQVMPMRQLGFAIEETTLKQVALNHGITMSVENMTQAQKAQLRYVAIMEQAGNIGVLGDMARTIDTASNGMRVFQARIQQFSRAVGNMLMPWLSAALPYMTAFVQVLTEGAQAIANFFGFELPKIDFSDAQVSSGFDDITGAIDEATEASEAFKGSLASIDQLNIIGSESENKLAAADNKFDLGINLPEYDFLQGVESKTKQIADNIKDWFKEALPWIEAVGAAIGAVFAVSTVGKFVGFLGSVRDLMVTIGSLVSGKFGKAAQIFSGIAGGLAAGAASGILLHNSIKNLITGTGKLGNNIAMLAGGVAIAGGAIAAFIALGNPVGAVITVVGAAVGALAGVVAGLDENIKKLNDEMAASILYDNGGTKISEIADAFGDWADKATALNRQTIDKYKQLDEYDTKIDSVLQTMQGITGIDIDFSGITPADAEALQEPFNTLVTYLQGEFQDRCSNALEDLKGVFLNLGLGDALTKQFEEGFNELNSLFNENLTESQKSVNLYLEKIKQGGALSETDMSQFMSDYSFIQEMTRNQDASWQGVQNSLKNLQELDLTKIDLENDSTAMQAVDEMISKYNEFYDSSFERLNEETANLNELRSGLDIQLKYGKIDQATYNEQIGLLDLSEALFAQNALNSIKEMRGQIIDILEGVDAPIVEAARKALPDLSDYLIAEGATGLFGWLTGDTQDIAKSLAVSSFIDKSELHSQIQDSLSGLYANIDIDIPVPAQGTAAYTTYLGLVNGGILPMTAEIELTSKSALDTEWAEKAGKWIEEGLERGWNIPTWENYTRKLAEMGAKAFCDTYGIHSPSTLFEKYGGFMMKGLENGVTRNENLVISAFDYTAVQSIMRLSKMKEDMARFNLGEVDAKSLIPDFSFKAPTVAPVTFGQQTGAAREAYSQAARQNAPDFGGDGMEANVTIYNYLEMDGDVIAEKVETRRVNMERRMNGR